MAKLLEAQIHEETKLWSLIVLFLTRSKYARKEQWREENRVKKIEDSSCSLPSHFWSTSRSPFSTFYIPFQHFKPCMIWSSNEEDIAFGRQLHQAEGEFRTSPSKCEFRTSPCKCEFRTSPCKCEFRTMYCLCDFGAKSPLFCRLHMRSFLLYFLI